MKAFDLQVTGSLVVTGSIKTTDGTFILSGSDSNASSSFSSRITTNESNMTLATASIAALTASISRLNTEISTDDTDMTLATASIAAITASVSEMKEFTKASTISGSFTSVSSSIGTRFDSRETDMTLATASIAAITASLGQPVNTDSNVQFADITSTGTITAVEVHTTFVSSSIAVASGSNTFGDDTADSHQFTGSVSISGSVDTLVSFGNVDFNGDLDVDGTTNLDVVDIDGAVDMASTLAVADDITLANNKYYQVKTTGGSAVRIAGLANDNNIYLGAIDDAGAGVYIREDASNVLTLIGGEVTASGELAVTDRLTVGAWDNSNSHGHGNINISADANEGADSYLNFAAGTTIKGHIAFDHHATAGSQVMKFVVGDDAVTAMNINGDGRLIIPQGLLEVGEHGVAGGQIVSDGDLTFNAGYNDSSTGNGDFIFQRYGESTSAATVAQIFSTGNAYFGGVTAAVNSSHFQYASTFGDTSAARVGFFNAASGNSSTDKTLALNIGCMGSGTSAYHPTNMVLASINFLGQANDATYAGGGIDMLVSTGGNIARSAVGTDMLFRTMDTSSTGGTERMRITSDGNVGIGTTSPTAFYPCLQIEGTQPAIIINDSNSDGFWTMIADGGNSNLYFDHSGAVRFLTATNNGGSSGTIVFQFNNDGTAEKSSGAGDWAGTSDVRLKKNVEDLNIDALNVLNTLRPVEFNWKNEELHNNPKDSNGKSYGFLADEIETVMPQLVTTSKIASGSADTEYLDEDKMAKKTELGTMASLYIKAIQQLTEKNEALEKRIEELEN